MSEIVRKTAILPRKKSRVSAISERNLMTAKIDLYRAYPFMGMLIMTTEYRFTDDIPTLAATAHGGNKIFINETFLNDFLYTRKLRSFVLAHEILHIFLEHIGRQTEAAYHPPLWNVSTDYCINSYLVELGNEKLQIPKSALYDKRFKDMSSDQIYHILLQENGGDPEKAAGQHGAGDIGAGVGDGKDGDDKDGNNKGQRPLDEVGRDKMTDQEKMENKAKIAASLEGQNIKNMGDGAAGLLRAFADLIEAKIPWQQVLKEFVTESSKSRYTYNRISRRSGKTILFPSQTGDKVNLLFGVDTSGSMSSRDLGDAISELKGICESYESWEVTFLSCDMNAEVIGHYVSEDGDEFETIDKKLIGGGGTDMSPMVQYANDMEEPPSVVVIITDGYIPETQYIEDIPVLLIITRDGNKDLQQEDAVILHMDEH